MPAAAAPRVPLPTILAFSAMGIPFAAYAVVGGVYLTNYYARLGLGLSLIGGAIFMVRLIDIVFDPLVSLGMDRTKTTIGRYRPWLIAGAPILMLAAWKLLVPGAALSVPYLVIWSLVAAVGTSFIALGVAAWQAKLATSYDDRSRIFGWTTGIAVIGSIGILTLPQALTHGKIVLGKVSSMPTIALIFLIALPIALAITVIFTPDKIAPGATRPRFSFSDMGKAISRPAMRRIIAADLFLTLGPGTTGPLYIFYFHDAKGFPQAQVNELLVFYIGAAFFGAPFWGRLAQRFSKHRTLQIACVFYAITQSILMAIPAKLFVPTMFGMFAVGFCASAFLVLVRAMVADVTDEVRLEQKQDLTSLIFSMVTTTTKIGGSITVLVSYSILQMVGYNAREAAQNTPQAVFGLEMCYLFAPIILVWVGGAMFFGYKLDAKRHAEIRSALAELDFTAAEESMTGLVEEPPDDRTPAAAE